MCNRVPDASNNAWVTYFNQPKQTTMQPGECWYLHLEESAHTSTPLVLTCNEPGRENPCTVDQWLKDDKTQQFTWDESTRAITNRKATGKFLNTDGEKVWLGNVQRTKWWYEQTTHTLETDVTGTHNTQWRIGVAQVRKWNPVTVTPYTGTPKQSVDALQNWRIEYCYKNK